MIFDYNTWDETYKSPFGAVQTGTEISFFIKSDADIVHLHGIGKKRTMAKEANGFHLTLTPELKSTVYFYRFEAVFKNKTKWFGKSTDSGAAVENGGDFQLTVHAPQRVPEWFKGSVMYQIYVDRFFKGSDKDVSVKKTALIHSDWNEPPIYIKNEEGHIVLWDFFGGNIDGVIQKLDYLKSLGVDVIYLNPIFEATSNHKYDTADYSKVDPMYGTERTLKRLVKQAKKRKMYVMLDGVFSHTGADSIYFNKHKTYGESGAYNDKNSPYYSWYKFEQYPDKYDCWWGVTDLPCVDELNPGFMDYLLNPKTGAVIKWMKTGISGWRLDVADELPDAFIKALKYAVLSVNPEAVLLGEVWEDASTKISYGKQRQYILGEALDSVSNYPLRDVLLDFLTEKMDAHAVALRVMTLQENYPKDIFLSLMNMTGTHDTERLFTLLGDAPPADTMNMWDARNYQLSEGQRKIAMARTILYYIILLTLPGNPCIYYGDEICLEGYKDPYNRGTFDWEANENRLTDLIKQLVELRNKLGIKNGQVSFDMTSDMLVYHVKTKDNTISICVNNTDKATVQHINQKNIYFSHKVNKETNSVKLLPKGAAIWTED